MTLMSSCGTMLETCTRASTTNGCGQAMSLLQIAEKYDLPGLKEQSEAAIAKALTVETAAETLSWPHAQPSS